MIDSQDELFETRDYRSIEIYNSSNRDIDFEVLIDFHKSLTESTTS